MFDSDMVFDEMLGSRELAKMIGEPLHMLYYVEREFGVPISRACYGLCTKINDCISSYCDSGSQFRLEIQQL